MGVRNMIRLARRRRGAGAADVVDSRPPRILVDRWRATERVDLVPLGMGVEVVMCSPSGAPKVGVLTSGAPVTVTIHGTEWPFAVLLLREHHRRPRRRIAPEYRASASRYFGDEQGEAWCASLPDDIAMERFRLEPSWDGLLDFDGMRRLPSAIAG